MFKKGLSEADLKQLYSQVFNGKLGKYPGQYRICLSDEANPKINPPRKFLHKMIKPLKRCLEEMVKTWVNEQVGHPTDWVNSMGCTKKKDGSLRVCLDPRHLNKHIKREHFTIPTFQEILSRVGQPTLFTIVDKSSAFWQIELEEDSWDLTTFQTPFGRFRFCRMPFGISSASVVQQKRPSKVLETSKTPLSLTTIC